MRHHPEHSFVERSQPPEPGVPATTNRAAFLAANPKARELQETQLTEFRERFSRYLENLRPLLHSFIDKIEQARQLGIVLIEFVDTLPGKRLTPDFYQQLKSEFTDGHGQTVSLELLEWFIKVARHNPDPITDYKTAEQWKQPALLAAGGEFWLESERAPQVAHGRADPLKSFKDLFYEADKRVKELLADNNYCPGGVPRKDLRPILRAELEPQKRALDAFWELLG